MENTGLSAYASNGTMTNVEMNTLVDKTDELVDARNISRKVYLWGDSLSVSSSYAQGIADILGNTVGTDVVIKGIGGSRMQHIIDRFSTFISANPSESDAYHVFYMGTNNMGYGAPADGMQQMYYAQSYRDQFFIGIKTIIDTLGHNRFTIISGQQGPLIKDTDIWNVMNDIDTQLGRMFPYNHLCIRDFATMDYNYLGITLDADFVKPAVGANVDITMNDVTWIGDTDLGNTTSQFCVGTKEYNDVYESQSILGNVVTSKLITDNISDAVAVGETMPSIYTFTSEVAETVNIQTRIYTLEDATNFINYTHPRTLGDDIIHYQNWSYELGENVGRQILKNTKNLDFQL